MFTLPKLQYKYDALEPYIDAKTMEIHHTKHHQTYIDKLNTLVDANPELNSKTLEELCLISETKNMAGGHLNHSFFWEIIGPAPVENSVVKPLEEILKFKDEFNDKASKLFGSGWVWIAKQDNEIKVISTPLQDSVLTVNALPILGIDLWEHAYYLKYQNRRAEYIDAFWNVINWEKVTENFNKLGR